MISPSSAEIPTGSKWKLAGRTWRAIQPPDFGVGMPADNARSQWDLSVPGTFFIGPTDLTVQAGHVWDLNRFPGQDVGNNYLRISTRIGVQR